MKPRPIDPNSERCTLSWGHHDEHDCDEHYFYETPDGVLVTHCCECGVETDTTLDGELL